MILAMFASIAAWLYLKKGALSSARKDSEGAIQKFDERILKPQQADSSKIHDELMKASVLNNLGRIDMLERNYKDAKKRFNDGSAILDNHKMFFGHLTQLEKKKEKRTIAALHTNLGLLYFKQGLLDDEKKECMEAVKSEELPETYNNLGVLFHKDGALFERERYYQGRCLR